MTAADLSCPRCSTPSGGFGGCPRCRADGVPVNLVPPLGDLRGVNLASSRGGPFGWPGTLPVAGPAELSLGEGDTPLVPLESVSDCRLWIKDESRNPTGSHKDRAMLAGVAAALEQGAGTVLAASSGNAGASAAAYAARAGLRCAVLTTTGITGVLADQIRAMGAALAVYPDTTIRDRMAEAAVTELGWYPLTNYVRPAAGGNAYANEGYKSIAYELARDLGSGVAAVVIPTSRADLLAGVERGYRELAAAGLVDTVPRLIVAETATAAAFTAALRRPDRGAQEHTTISRTPSPAFSIGSVQPSWQGLRALWSTGGTAVAVDVEEYMAEHRRLPATTGLFLEASSAVAVVVARRVHAEGVGTVVALGTGSGLKGLGVANEPVLANNLDALVDLCL